MRVLFYFSAVILTLSGCSQQPVANQQTADKPIAQDKSEIPDIDTICFERYSSLKKQDMHLS